MGIIICAVIFISCASKDQTKSKEWKRGQDYSTVLFSVEGFEGPEAVRYDEELDVYFVSCFVGSTSGDANGYVSKVSSSGEIIELKYMTGTEQYPFDAGRGMYITGDTLWVADHSGVHYFNKKTGNQIGFVDFSRFEPGFINDIVGKDGDLYVTDTGQRKVYRIRNLEVELVKENLPIMPNGITTLPNGNLVFAPWNDGPEIYQYDVENDSLSVYATAAGSNNYDGIEYFEGGLITSTQFDSSLHLMIDGRDELFIKLPGRPADIAIDPNRGIVAVPYVALNRVDFWELKE
ncbi:MAG: SMP-30/gluconolactonase/LRE family protein [Balneola sp.]